MAHPIVFGGATPPPANYQISNSVRFNGTNSYFSRTQINGDGTRYTIAFWVKISSVTAYKCVVSAGSSSRDELHISPGNGRPTIYFLMNGGTYWVETSAYFRDPSAWTHVCVAVDTNQAIPANRIKIYVNGAEISSFQATSYPTSGYASKFNINGESIRVGYDLSINRMDGYLSDYYLIDGQALSPSSFGKIDDNGVWVPIQYTGTYGTNGCKLEFKNSAALGTDTSGNGNHWTVNGLTAADQMADSPTNNFCTWNPLSPAATSLSLANGNTTVANSQTSSQNMWATQGLPSAWYCEMTLSAYSGTSGWCTWGFADPALLQNTTNITTNTTGVWTYTDNGSFGTLSLGNATFASVTRTTAANDIFMFAGDRSSGKWWMGANGTWFNDGNPATGLNPLSSNLTSESILPFFNTNYGQQLGRSISLKLNSGQTPFTYTPPSGFKALCTANLSAAPITNPSKHFNAVLYTGNGGTKAVTGMGFQPGFLWGKERSTSRNHFLQNEVVGPQSYLSSNVTDIEAYKHVNGYVQSFDADGFTVTAGSTSALTVNENNGAYVAWAWKAGGSAVTNTDGSVTSQVSANPSSGFSIVTATIPGSGTPFTIGHGLGAAPSMIISKSRSHDNNWVVYLKDRGAGKYMTFTEAAEASDANVWANTNPTSTVFFQDYAWYGTSPNMIFYCFAEIPGYSRFGSYIGNGNPDGPFIYCGFCPRWIMVKKVSAALNDWMLWDTSRQLNNPNNVNLYVDTSGAEGADRAFDLLSNGFKVRDGSGYQTNGNDLTYIFAAFAEHPFGGSNVSPSLAR